MTGITRRLAHWALPGGAHLSHAILMNAPNIAALSPTLSAALPPVCILPRMCCPPSWFPGAPLGTPQHLALLSPRSLGQMEAGKMGMAGSAQSQVSTAGGEGQGSS